MRQVEPEFLGPYGYTLLPHIHCTIAMIVAHEGRKEEEMKATICRLLEPKSAERPEITTTALEYLEHCLIIQYCLDNADARMLAAFSIRLVLWRCQILDYDSNTLLNALGVPDRSKYDELLNIIEQSMFEWAGKLFISDILKAMPHHLLSADNPVHNGVAMAHRIWKWDTERSVMCTSQWRNRKRIMAWCLHYTFKICAVKKSYDEILEMAGGVPQWQGDLMVERNMNDIPLRDWARGEAER